MTLAQKELFKKIYKVVRIVVIIACIACLIGTCSKISKQNFTIKQDQIRIKALTEQVDSLQRYASALGAESVLTVNVNFNMTQKNILSFSQSNCQNIAKEVSTMTRKELYDSLYTKKPEK